MTDSSRSQHQSFKGIESIYEFETDREEGGDRGDFDILHPRIQEVGKGKKMPSKIREFDPELNSQRSGLIGYLKSIDDGNHLSGKTKNLEWTPDFQPLSSVFTEIARLKGESIPTNSLPLDKSLPLSHLHNRTLRATPGPPPLLTSIPQQSHKLSAPIPISTQPSKAETHVPLRGFYPRPVSHYHTTQVELPPLKSHPQPAPPSYSLVMSSRPSSGGSIRSRNSRSSLHSQSRNAAPFSVAPSISGALSGAPFLSRSPFSYQSSLTSPAMSPSLSPSLTPLTIDSPAFELANNKATKAIETPDLTRAIRSHSKKKTKERMVHV